MCELSPAKPHKTYSELVVLLKERGMLIRDPQWAERKLAQIGYYRLSGFWYPCRKGRVDEEGNYLKAPDSGLPLRDDQFQEGVSFDTIMELYLFDKNLRLLLLDAIERVEIQVRTIIAHELGRHNPLAYGDDAYINPKVLQAKTGPDGELLPSLWQQWLDKQQHLIGESKEDCILWHRKNGMAIPFWVVVETWDFGIMSKYYENLRGSFQEKICARLEVPNKKVLAGWLQEINILRNHCAHHSRIWNRSSKNALKLLNNEYFDALDLSLEARKRIYGKICVLWYLVQKIGPHSEWIERVADLMDRKPSLACCPFTAMGMPDNNGFPRKLFQR